jgi:septal ring factor EnvC (AmiA/AmiB activator)
MSSVSESPKGASPLKYSDIAGRLDESELRLRQQMREIIGEVHESIEKERAFRLRLLLSAFIPAVAAIVAAGVAFFASQRAIKEDLAAHPKLEQIAAQTAEIRESADSLLQSRNTLDLRISKLETQISELSKRLDQFREALSTAKPGASNSDSKQPQPQPAGFDQSPD